jgi:hypothetical protein
MSEARKTNALSQAQGFLRQRDLQELAAAPEQVRNHLARVPEAHIETLQLGAEAMVLAEAYVAAGVIAAKMRADAQHLSVARDPSTAGGAAR